jgi:hypothetical protein
VSERWTPQLELGEFAGRCRLSLGRQVDGYGPTLQEAADDLVARLLRLALAFRSSGFAVAPEALQPDRAWLDFVWEIGELAARGEDVRGRVLGPQPA